MDVRAKPYSSRRERGQGWVEMPPPPFPEKGGRKCWDGLLGSLRFFLGCSACWAPRSSGTQVGRPPSGGKQKVPTRILIRTPLLGRWLRRISITFIAPNWAGSRPGVPSQGYSPTSGHMKVQSKFFLAPTSQDTCLFDWGRFVRRSLPTPPRCPFSFPSLPISS